MKKYFVFLKTNERANNILFWAAVLLVPMLCVMIPDLVTSGFTTWALYADFWQAKFVMLCCALMFSGLMLALSALMRHVAVPAGILMLVSLVAGFTNTQKLLYRQTPVIPSDFLMIRDGMTAAGEFTLVFSKTFIAMAVLCLVILILLLPVRFPGARKERSLIKSAAGFLIGIVVCAGLLFGVSFNSKALEKLGYRALPKEVALDYTYNTFYPAFLNLVPDTIVRAPDDYSIDVMQEIGNGIAGLSTETAAGRQADIVILQLESFFIPDQYDLVYDREEVFGDLFALQECSAYGSMISPLTGGGTADVEFEMLTGFTSNDSQITTNPFSVYTYEGFPNIVGYLASHGYETESVHSFNTSLYNRVNAYHNLGFGTSIFDDSFANPEYRGTWITDGCCIDKAIEEYEAMQAGGRLLHIVTVQNHVPVQWDAYEDDELVQVTSPTLSGDDLRASRIFLTSCRDICREARRLAEYLDASGRDVILIVYGDHQVPIIRVEGYSVPQKAGLTDDIGEYTALTHGTPFYVHTTFNSGLEGQDWGRLAPNSILVKALCDADVMRPAYFQYLYESQNLIKSLTGAFAILQDDTVVLEMTDELKADVRIRQLIQHDIVHGKKYILEVMY